MPTHTPVAHILVLDDDEVMRDLLDAVLSQEGYRVTLASSGEQALQILKEGRSPDLVLTDVQMPGLAEEALAKALRKAIPSGTLLIGMSGSEPPETTRATFDAFLRKPFDLAGLAAAVRTAGGRPANSTSATTGVEEKEHTPVTGASETPVLAPLDETIFAALAKSIPAPQLGQLYEMTLTDIDRRHARMQTAAAAGDLAALQREAHTVKGSCGFVGATELQALAASLEAGTTSSTSALGEIPAACLRLRGMLKSKLNTA